MKHINFLAIGKMIFHYIPHKVSLYMFMAVAVSSFMDIQAANASKGLPVPGLDMVGGEMYVYHDFAFTGNHFPVKALMAGQGQDSLLRVMNDNYRIDPYSGNSCIECSIDVVGDSWGGWMFTYGYLPKGSDEYIFNFGEYPDCGYNLNKAEKLTFWAKGKNGGEKVEFFIGGMGWNPELKRPQQGIKYPDSAQKISTKYITLDKKWTEYVIPLDSADLSYISCGFGFAASGNYNNGNVTFYLDEIKFVAKEEQDDEGFNFALWIPVIVAVVAGIFGLIKALLSRGKKKE